MSGAVAFPSPAYSEGTFTPVLSFTTAGDSNIVHSEQVGTYVRIGNLVVATVNVNTSTFTHTTASGNLQVTGLPFTPRNVSNDFHAGTCVWMGITKVGYTHVVPFLTPNTTGIQFTGMGTGVANSTIVAADVPTGGTPKFRLTVAYLV